MIQRFNPSCLANCDRAPWTPYPPEDVGLNHLPAGSGPGSTGGRQPAPERPRHRQESVKSPNGRPRFRRVGWSPSHPTPES